MAKTAPGSKSKVQSKSSPKFISTGSGRMSGPNSAGPQVAGQSAQMGKGGGKFATGGGSGRMAKKGSAKNQTAA